MKLEVARALGLATIFVAAFLIIVPFVNVAPNVFPLNPGLRDWRFGALGFILTALTMPTLGLGLLALGGALRGSRRAALVTLVIALLLSVVAVPGLTVFLLDGMALRNAASDPRVHPMYNQGMARTVVLSVLAIPALLAVAAASFKGMKSIPVGEPAGVESGLFVSKS